MLFLADLPQEISKQEAEGRCMEQGQTRTAVAQRVRHIHSGPLCFPELNHSLDQTRDAKQGETSKGPIHNNTH